jgi:hypothetical protein
LRRPAPSEWHFLAPLPSKQLSSYRLLSFGSIHGGNRSVSGRRRDGPSVIRLSQVAGGALASDCSAASYLIHRAGAPRPKIRHRTAADRPFNSLQDCSQEMSVSSVAHFDTFYLNPAVGLRHDRCTISKSQNFCQVLRMSSYRCGSQEFIGVDKT